MGHNHLHRLPATRKWQQVVELLGSDAGLERVVGASASAADEGLQAARHDQTVAHAFWLLTQLPLAARAADFSESARKLGIEIGAEPTLVDVVTAFSEAMDRAAPGRKNRTDLGEMAHHAAAESVLAVAGADLPGLFGPNSDDIRLALGRLAAPQRFAALSRDFFSRLSNRHLLYYLGRALSDHVGPGKRLPTTADHSDFNAALELHCREASRIVERFSGDWFSKANYEGGVSLRKARKFVFVALGKISAELRRRAAESA